ncbi:MAG: hypothetical protein IBX45_04295, partial [Campylobacterales bacterium]|nr:hypothetical protein [Campylobacterales bacterium]
MNRFSLRMQMALLVLVALGVSSVCVMMVSSYKTRDVLIQKNYEKLTVARDMKRFFLEKFFSDQEAGIRALAQLDEFHTVVHDLLYIYRRAEIGAQDVFPIDHPSLKFKTARHDAFLKTYQRDYGYGDVYVLDPVYGHVMYTAAKRSDLGMSLSANATNPLAKLWKEALQSPRPIFADMQSYVPNENQPTMFVASRIQFGE